MSIKFTFVSKPVEFWDRGAGLELARLTHQGVVSLAAKGIGASGDLMAPYKETRPPRVRRGVASPGYRAGDPVTLRRTGAMLTKWVIKGNRKRAVLYPKLRYAYIHNNGLLGQTQRQFIGIAPQTADLVMERLKVMVRTGFEKARVA